MIEDIAFKYFNASVLMHFIGRLLYRTFIPILLLQIGYSLNHALFYTVGLAVISIVVLLMSVHFLSRKNVVLFNMLAIFSELILLFMLLPQKISYIVFLGIVLFEGLYNGFYYFSYNSIIAHCTSKEKSGNNVGNLKIMTNISALIAPIIGAVILIYSKIVLVVVSILFLVSSVIPILKIVKTDANGVYLPKISFERIQIELIRKLLIGSNAFVIFFLWAIYIYHEGFSIFYISLIPVAFALSDIIFIYTIKKRLNSKIFCEKLWTIGLLGIIIFSIYRYYHPTHIFMTNILLGLSFTAIFIVNNTNYLKLVKGYQTYYSSVIYESTGFLGWVILAPLLFFVGLKGMILIPAVICVLYIVLDKYMLRNAGDIILNCNEFEPGVSGKEGLR